MPSTRGGCLGCCRFVSGRDPSVRSGDDDRAAGIVPEHVVATRAIGMPTSGQVGTEDGVDLVLYAAEVGLATGVCRDVTQLTPARRRGKPQVRQPLFHRV